MSNSDVQRQDLVVASKKSVKLALAVDRLEDLVVVADLAAARSAAGDLERHDLLDEQVAALIVRLESASPELAALISGWR